MGGERKFYDDVLNDDFDPLGWKASSYFEEIVLGTHSFGPIDPNWKPWIQYFLAQDISQHSLDAQQVRHIGFCVTAFVIQYPTVEEARGVAFDAILDTLGRWACAPFLWQENDLRIAPRHHNSDLPLEFSWNKVDETLSASLFFCWKYLPTEEIETWVESLFAISGAWWRAELLLWLVSAHPFVTGEKTQPSQLGKEQPDLTWDCSSLLDGSYDGGYPAHSIVPFLDEENRAAMQNALQKHVNQKLFFDWLDSFASTRDVESALGDFWPLRFAELYLD